MNKRKTRKRKGLVYPRWMTTEERDLLDHARRGLVPREVRDAFREIQAGRLKYPFRSITIVDTSWDGIQDKTTTIKFTDIPINQAGMFMVNKYGEFFGGIYLFALLDYQRFPRPEADKKTQQMMRHTTGKIRRMAEMGHEDAKTILRERAGGCLRRQVKKRPPSNDPDGGT